MVREHWTRDFFCVNHSASLIRYQNARYGCYNTTQVNNTHELVREHNTRDVLLYISPSLRIEIQWSDGSQ